MTRKIYGLPEDYWDTYPSKIMTVTAEQVERVAKKYLDQDTIQVVAVGLMKSASARVNARLGELPVDVAAAIASAADRVAEGEFDAQFPLVIFQTGSGTSTNMNANEVIGHLAKAHPNDQVNRGQSS